MTSELDERIVQEIAEWQHCDAAMVMPGYWILTSWYDDKAYEVVAIPQREDEE